MLVKHSFYYLGGRILAGLLGLSTLTVFTHVLSPSEYGEYALIVATSALIVAVLFEWIRQGLVRFSAGSVSDQQQLMPVVRLLFAFLCLITAAVGALAWTFFFGDIWHGILIGIVCFLAWSQAWFDLNLDVIRSQFRAARYCAASVVRAALALSFGLLGIALNGGVIGLLIGVALANLVSSCMLFTRQWLERASRLPGGRTDIKLFVVFGAPLSATLALAFVADSADRFMLAWFKTSADVGIYAAAYNLAQYSVIAILVGIGTAGYPLAVNFIRNQNKKGFDSFVRKYAFLLCAIGLPAMTGISILAASAGRVLIGNFDPVITPSIIILISMAAFLFGLKTCYFDWVFMLRNRTGWLAGISGTVAAVNIIANVFLIPACGGIGAAASTLGAFAMGLALSVFAGRKLLPLPLISRDILKMVAADAVMGLVLLVAPAAYTWQGLLMAITLGITVYGGALFLFNPMALRSTVQQVLRRYLWLWQTRIAKL